MTRIIPSFLIITALALVGCGDDGGSNCNPDVDAGPLPVDQCVNADDMDIVDALYADGGSGLDVGDYVLDCTQTPGSSQCYSLVFDECATDQQRADCLADCTMGTDVEGLTDGCLLCYAATTNCGAELCLIECLAGVDSCNSCLIAMGCIDTLEDCTGLATP